MAVEYEISEKCREKIENYSGRRKLELVVGIMILPEGLFGNSSSFRSD